jgi:hypothetical protein
MSNKFCRHLSNGYKIDLRWDNTLLWSPCCYYSKKVSLFDKEAFEKELAYTSNATGWLPECNLCRRMEASQAGAQVSPRLDSFNRISNELDDGVCGNLELSFDSKCNAACLSCGSYISDTWKKYDYKNGIRDVGPIVEHGPALATQVIESIPLDQLTELYVLGGEPFYSNSGNMVLRHLIKVHPDVSKVKLRYQTNGSMVPDEETRELWQGFKSVEISMSLDDIGDRFDYLRWPLKWHRIEKTVDNLLSTTNAILAVNATISPLNVLYFQELDDWADSTIPTDRLKCPDAPTRPNRCMGTMDLNKTPVEMRQRVTEMYGVEHRLSKIFSNLEFNPGSKDMFEYLEVHDKIRKLDWRKTFPDIVEFFKDAK